MRASLLAVIAIAVIAGLGVVALVRFMGLLDAPPPVVVAEPAPVVAPPPPPPPQVLVSARSMVPGDVLEPEYLTARAVRPGELADYNANRESYLTPSPTLFYFRYVSRDVPSDQPLTVADLAPPRKIEALHSRLFPGTRAVSLGLKKPNSAGGLIQVGDWVDVYLTTDVRRTDSPTPIPYTGLLAPHALVVAKRDTLLPLHKPIKPDEAIEYMLATNPYRAALLEYGRSVGELSLVPVSESEKDRLDKLRDETASDPALTVAATYAPAGTTDYEAELARIRGYQTGSFSIGTNDLAQILGLPPARAPQSVEIYAGVNRSGVTSFGGTASGSPGRPAYLFAAPPASAPAMPSGR